VRRICLSAAGVVLVVMLHGCAATEQSFRAKGMAPQTQKELEEFFAKPVKLRFDNNTGGKGTVTYMPDGTARVEWPGGGDTGTWQVKDGKICMTWTKLRDGKEGCFTSYKVRPKEYMSFNPDGSWSATSTEVD
jgi:hypothetical protein